MWTCVPSGRMTNDSDSRAPEHMDALRQAQASSPGYIQNWSTVAETPHRCSMKRLETYWKCLLWEIDTADGKLEGVAGKDNKLK